MKAEQFTPQMRVAYVPNHAHGNLNHDDVETGTVSSNNGINVFVKFDKQLVKFGWDGTTSQSCSPESLVPIFPKLKPEPVPIDWFPSH